MTRLTIVDEKVCGATLFDLKGVHGHRDRSSESAVRPLAMRISRSGKRHAMACKLCSTTSNVRGDECWGQVGWWQRWYYKGSQARSSLITSHGRRARRVACRVTLTTHVASTFLIRRISAYAASPGSLHARQYQIHPPGRPAPHEPIEINRERHKLQEM